MLYGSLTWLSRFILDYVNSCRNIFCPQFIMMYTIFVRQVVVFIACKHYTINCGSEEIEMQSAHPNLLILFCVLQT